MSITGKQEGGPYRLLLDLAEKTARGLEAFDGFIREPDAVKEARIRVLAAAAGSSLRCLDEAVEGGRDETLDPEDVFKLSRAVSGLMEAARLSSEEMLRFGVPTDGFLREMAGTLRSASAELREAVMTLIERPRDCEEHVLRLKKSAGYAEGIQRKALAELLKSPGAVTLLKTREVYSRLSEAAGRCDEAAEILGDVLVKAR